MTYNSQIISIVTFIYGLAGVLYVAAWVFRKELAGRIATWVAWIAWLGLTAALLIRWYESYQLAEGYGHAPLSNMFESLVFFAWTIGIIYLIVEWRYKNKVVGGFVMLLAFLALAYASLRAGDQIQPLVPVLKSNWLIAHVFTCFIGYAAFAVASGVSLIYLVKGGRDNHVATSLIARLPATKIMDELNHQLIVFGFLFLTVGIISGAVWANSAWGRYWGWDPKETWSFVTWLVYATLLHARMMRGWRGTRIAVLCLVGFAAVVFTYFGVNLLPGLHSYGAK